MAYDLTQTVFLLSMASNRASVAQGTAQQLATFLTYAVNQGGSCPCVADGPDVPVTGFLASVGAQLAGGAWTVPWGPAVFQNTNNTDDNEADNAMFVAFNNDAANPIYVVAIAATNAVSIYDWDQEDANVGPQDMVAFPINLNPPFDNPSVTPTGSTVPADAQVSAGTALGVYTLCTGMIDQAGATLSLIDYLSNLGAPTAAKIIFTGHSLAGALAPTLALQLWETGVLTKGGFTLQNVLVMPTAGATPGNLAFATLFNTTLSPQSAFPAGSTPNAGNQLTQFNVLYWNFNDIVPRAWTQFGPYYQMTGLGTATSLIGKVKDPTIYKPICAELGLMIGSAGLRGSGCYFTQLLANQSLTANWPVHYWNGQALAWLQFPPPPAAVQPDLRELDGLLHRCRPRPRPAVLPVPQHRHPDSADTAADHANP